MLAIMAALLFLAGLLNDPPWAGYDPQERVKFYGESMWVAWHLLARGEFSDPFSTGPSGLTAHVPPGYPFLQAVVLAILGDTAASPVAIRALPVVSLSLQYALLPYVARLFGFSVWTGVLAALLGILMKPGRAEPWEANFAGLLVLLLAASMFRWRRGDRKASGAAQLGLVAGVVFLFQPVIAAVYFPWAVWRQRPWLAARFLLLVLTPLAVCAPWMARTYVALGGPVWIRDNLGIEMFISYNDCALYGIRESERIGCFQALHPNQSPEEARVLRDMGEYRYNQDRLRKAISWIAEHPGRSARLAMQRLWYFWFPSDRGWEGYREQGWRRASLHVMTLASLIGLWLAFRARLPAAGMLALWLALFPLIYYVVQYESRYRHPILWITWLLAAHAVLRFALAPGDPKAPPWRVTNVST
jgi:hypothetical protein